MCLQYKSVAIQLFLVVICLGLGLFIANECVHLESVRAHIVVCLQHRSGSFLRK